MNNSIAFVICCKDSLYIEKCIENINILYPQSSIYIVDSCSDNKSYFNSMAKYNNVLIEDICNKNYEYGAYIHCFNKYKDNHDIFIFMQDSILINNSIPEISYVNENNVYVFNNNYSGWSQGIPHRDLFYSLNPDFPKTDPSQFLMTIWNSFIILKKTFNKIINSNIFNSAKPPEDKLISCAWERVWSIIFNENNIQINHININNITKIFGCRQ